jgi:hypothetical protein
VIEQAEKAKGVSDKIRNWLSGAALGAVTLGVQQIYKDVTAPFWLEVADKIIDLYNAIKVFVSLLL